MDERAKTAVAPQSLSRRDLLDWIGRGAVLYLGAELLAACGPDSARPGTADADGGGPLDAGPDLSVDAPWPDAGEGDFGFSPGEAGEAVFPAGTVRTVDRQDLVAILRSWRLAVDGMVARPTVFTFGDLVGLPRQDQETDFHCVEGWSVFDVPWNGLHLSQLLSLVQPDPSATHVTFHTIGDVYNESLPLSVALEPRSLLAYGIAGETIPENRGFPLRLVVPRLWAYKSAKFVYRVELTDHPVNGFWEDYGYPYDAEVPPDKLRAGRY